MRSAKKERTSKKKSTQVRGGRILEKKKYLEFVTAILSVPFFISVLILNFNSIKTLVGGKVTPTVTPSTPSNPGGSGFFVQPIPNAPRPTTQTNNTSGAPCTKSLGPLSITSPEEGDTVTTNPVQIDISYDDSTYCAAAWSYRVNGGEWSGYDNRSVALYNLPKGTITFELRAQSIAGSDTTTITRKFTYSGDSSSVFPTSASNSAN